MRKLHVLYVQHFVSAHPTYFPDCVMIGYVHLDNSRRGFGLAQRMKVSLEEWANQGGE